MCNDTLAEKFNENHCIRGHSNNTWHSKAGMSNWRPAGRMRPHGLFNVARCDLFKLNYHLKLKVIHNIWLIFVHFAIKLAKICLKLTQRVICNSKLRPAVSFSSFTTQCAARTVIWVWHACSKGSQQCHQMTPGGGEVNQYVTCHFFVHFGAKFH